MHNLGYMCGSCGKQLILIKSLSNHTKRERKTKWEENVQVKKKRKIGIIQFKKLEQSERE